MDNNIAFHNNNSNYDLHTDKNSISSESRVIEEKTQGPYIEEEYTPSKEITQKYEILKRELNELNMDNCGASLNPDFITSNDFDLYIDNAKTAFKDGIKMCEDLMEKELEDTKKEKEHWEERIENDKRHLDSLQKAKKETDVLTSVKDVEKNIIPFFNNLTTYFGELAKKTADNKAIQETYTKVILYIQNKPLDKKEECQYCKEINSAYHYIRKQFAKEDKWVKILDDQMLVSKLGTKDKHKDLVLNGTNYKDIVKTVEELHSLYFMFENALVFSIDETMKTYKSVKYGKDVIDLDILGEKSSLQKPSQ